MTEPVGETGLKQPLKGHKNRRLCLILVTVFSLLLILCLIVLILACTVFKPKDPETTVLSATVTGFRPRVTFPVLNFELNVTLDIELLVRNPNHATFSYGEGRSNLYYREIEVGQADLDPGNIPANGSRKFKTKLTIEADKAIEKISDLIRDVIRGEVEVDAKTKLKGKVTFLRIFRHHAVATADCGIAIGFPDLQIRRQDCVHKTGF
ncbi:hypothetical protein AMTRI_Chr08g210400 [Amborella trichopoda]